MSECIVTSDGTQVWYHNGQRHRTDGPAIILPDGTQGWYINHKHITKEAKSWMKKITYLGHLIQMHECYLP